MLGKWPWHYGIERDVWWRVVVDSKYGSSWGGWCSLELAGAYGVGVWKNIRKGWDSFSSFTRVVVGDGTNINFWNDLWCRDTALKVAFPALFGIAHVKDASVANNLEFLSGSNQWNMSFKREAHNWEVNVFASFFQALHSVKVSRGSEHKLWWVSSKKWLVIFSGKVFGALRLLRGWPSLGGPQLLARSLPWTISGSCMLS